MTSRVGGLVLLGLALLSARQAWTYQSDVVLWAHAHDQAPTKPRPLINLGVAYQQRGDWVAAKRVWQQAERLARLPRPDVIEQRRSRVLVHFNLATSAVQERDCTPLPVYEARIRQDDPAFADAQQQWFADMQQSLCLAPSF